MTAATTILTGTASPAVPAGLLRPSIDEQGTTSRTTAPSPSNSAVPESATATARTVVAGVAAIATGHRAGHGDHSTGGAAAEYLIRQRADLPAGHADRAVLRERAIEAGLPLSRYLAGRYRERGESLEDLYQVAAIGLIKAVDGYDPARTVAFTAYAVPTIVGALKRHFRDTTWRVRVPRSVQELALTLAPTSAGLAQRLGHSPTRAELAAHLGATEHDVAVALNAWGAYNPRSLDVLPRNGQAALIDTLGVVDTRFDAVNDQHSWQRLLAGLPLRERRILAMRFGDEMTQSEIAAQIGVSQMHVSRLLLRAMTALRTGIRTEQPLRSTLGTPAPDTA
jgi:RNA polymerase sigma-B factor